MRSEDKRLICGLQFLNGVGQSRLLVSRCLVFFQIPGKKTPVNCAIISQRRKKKGWVGILHCRNQFSVSESVVLC